MAAVFVFVKYSLLILLATCLMALVRDCSAMPSNSRPPRPGSPVFEKTADCQNDNELLDLCQRCAKLTKAKSAYPACCSDDLTARRWCSDFVYFGAGPEFPRRTF